jgi:transposase
MKSQPAKKGSKDKQESKKTSGKSTPGKWEDMNRKQRREMMRQMQSADLNLEVGHPHPAGIDIGNASHYVAGTAEPRPPTGAMLWLRHRRAEDDGGMAEAMWDSYGRDAIYGSLLDCGLGDLGRGGPGSVFGECARDEKSAGAEDGCAGEPVVDEAAHFRLIAEFVRPSQEIRTLRTYWRQRHDLVRSTGRHIQRMQKALMQMNIQLANVISDISGVTGQAIVKAILDGQRDPRELAAYRDHRVEASEEEIAQALEGNWADKSQPSNGVERGKSFARPRYNEFSLLR